MAKLVIKNIKHSMLKKRQGQVFLIWQNCATFANPKKGYFMFAVVKIAGQQFKVEKDQQLYVPHIGGTAGDKVEFSDVLLTDNDGKVTLGSANKVTAEVMSHLQGDKVIAFKMKRRKGFRKKHGHRTVYTKIKVTGIA
jgi:large subunit ribosomal protein L21